MNDPQHQRRREGFLWISIVVLVLALVDLLTLERWGIRLWGQPLDYTRFGNWGEAISGIGTTAAVVVALAVFYHDRANQRLAEAARETETETAVFHWLTSTEVRDQEDKLVGRLWDLKIQNSTGSPIYHWKATFDANNHSCNYLKHPLLPGENVLNLPFLDNLAPSTSPEPALVFEGRSGRIWIRFARGSVEESTSKVIECEHTPASVSVQVGK